MFTHLYFPIPSRKWLFKAFWSCHLYSTTSKNLTLQSSRFFRELTASFWGFFSPALTFSQLHLEQYIRYCPRAHGRVHRQRWGLNYNYQFPTYSNISTHLMFLTKSSNKTITLLFPPVNGAWQSPDPCQALCVWTPQLHLAPYRQPHLNPV